MQAGWRSALGANRTHRQTQRSQYLQSRYLLGTWPSFQSIVVNTPKPRRSQWGRGRMTVLAGCSMHVCAC